MSRFRFLAALLALLASPLGGQGNPPAWNYSPMHTEGVFEGLVFAFVRPVADTATIKVFAIVDGEEVHVARSVAIKVVVDSEGRATGGYQGRLPMKLGEKQRVKVTWIEITEGKYFCGIKNPEEAQYYQMTAPN